MNIQCLKHVGVSECLLGLGLSYGFTSIYDKWEDVPEGEQVRIKIIAQRLAGKGGGEDKFLRQIIYWWDITAPSYWWPQFDQYKISTTTQSESKMHSLTRRPFKPEDFEIEDLSGYRKLVDQFMPDIDEDTEVWGEVPGYPAVYASNQGRVKRLSYTATDGRFFKERILTNIIQKDGYTRSIFFNEGKTVNVPTHRIIALAFVQNPENKPYVNHIDGNKQNNRAENLEWVTQKENVAHSINTGLTSKNTLGGYAGKFSLDERKKIIERWNNGETMREIARSLGVSHSLIGGIIHGKYKYNQPKKSEFNEFCKVILEPLNELREVYLQTKDKEIWMQILNMLPQGYKQRRIVTISLAQMLNIYRQRKNHKLSEWRQVCDAFVENTPAFLKEMYNE